MRRTNSDKVEFQDVLAKKETDKAILCTINGSDVWIPKSQIDPDSEVKEEDDEGELIVTEWIAKEKGLI